MKGCHSCCAATDCMHLLCSAHLHDILIRSDIAAGTVESTSSAFWHTGIWGVIYAVRPQIVGGCRPQDILPYLTPNWSVTTAQTIPGALLRSQLVVAQKQVE